MPNPLNDIAAAAGIPRQAAAKLSDRDLLVLMLVELRVLNARLATDSQFKGDLDALRVDEAYDLNLTS